MSNSQAVEQQRQLHKEQQMRDVAAEQAAHDAVAGGTKSPRWMELFGDPDIDPPQGADAGSLSHKLAPELSRHHIFGNITEEERDRLQILNQGLAMQVKAEHPRRTGPSSKCVGQYRELLLGEDKPVLDDEMAREVDSALGEEGVRSQMQSQSVNAKAFDGLTQIQSVAMTEEMGGNGSSESGGVLSKTKSILGFGNSGDN